MLHIAILFLKDCGLIAHFYCNISIKGIVVKPGLIKTVTSDVACYLGYDKLLHQKLPETSQDLLLFFFYGKSLMNTCRMTKKINPILTVNGNFSFSP